VPGDGREPAGVVGAQAQPTGASAGKTSAPAEDRAARPVPPILTFAAKTLEGRRYEAATLAGRPAVLWFWAPWCATCAGPGPTVAEVAQQYGDRLGVLGVAGLGDIAAMRGFVADTETGGVTHLNDRTGAVWRRFEVTEQSTFVLIDKSGRVVHTGWLDSVDFAQRVAAMTG
jgi:thiol-disulfide isomerase/thioredoxin